MVVSEKDQITNSDLQKEDTELPVECAGYYYARMVDDLLLERKRNI